MGIGGTEMALIFVVVLLLFGAKKLPELAKGIGKAMGEFRSAQREFQDEIRRAEYTVKSDERRQIYTQNPPQPQPQTQARHDEAAPNPAPAQTADTAKTENTDHPA